MKKIQICTGKSCGKTSPELIKALKKKNPDAVIENCGCLSKCSFAPNAKIINNEKERIVTGQTERSLQSELDVLSGKKIMGGTAKRKLNTIFDNSDLFA